MVKNSETFTFQTEAKELLDLMVYSVYSNRDIFLRELVSNASDALDKLHLDSLTDQDLVRYAENPVIRIVRDSGDRKLSIIDNGIGMNRDEIISFIGTIAKSGTKEFLKMAKSKKDVDLTEMLIGQFGVGFYSAFMVADSVTLLTRRAGDEVAWKWESTGDGTYTLEQAERPEPGTTVSLSLKDIDQENGLKDYTNEWVIREIVKKYSDFVSYPIIMKVEHKKDPKDENSEILLEDETLNSMKAIWMRPESDVSEEEYNEFYKHVSRDWMDPLARISFSMEGVTELHGLLFIPSKAPWDLFMRERREGISLYVKRVFIMSDCKEIMPEYLRFVKGVLDSEDLSLNISREILQQDRQVDLIRRSSVRKILSELQKIMKEDHEKYLKFWNEFGVVLKEGIISDQKNSQAVMKLCQLHSTQSESELTSLSEYVERMKEGQNEIYYLTGPSLESLKNSPHLETFRKKGYEVLFLSDPVDELWVPTAEFDGKKFCSVAQGQVTLEESEEEKENRRKKEESFKSLIDFLGESLKEKVKDVRLSSRLTNSPACLVGEANDATPQLRQMMEAMGQSAPEVKRILEVNPDHPVLRKMEELFNSGERRDEIGEYAEILWGQAVLAEGGQLDNPSDFSRKIADLMIKSL